MIRLVLVLTAALLTGDCCQAQLFRGGLFGQRVYRTVSYQSYGSSGQTSYGSSGQTSYGSSGGVSYYRTQPVRTFLRSCPNCRITENRYTVPAPKPTEVADVGERVAAKSVDLTGDCANPDCECDPCLCGPDCDCGRAVTLVLEEPRAVTLVLNEPRAVTLALHEPRAVTLVLKEPRPAETLLASL